METKDSIAIEKIILDFYASDDENLTNCVYDIHAYYLKNILTNGFTPEDAGNFLADYEEYRTQGKTRFDKYINKSSESIGAKYNEQDNRNEHIGGNLHTIECPNCIEGLIVKIKGKLFCEDCHIELK